MLRRPRFILPRREQIPDLVRVLKNEKGIEPANPRAFAEAAIEHRVIGAVSQAAREGRLSLPAAERSLIDDAQAVAVLKAGLLRRELPGVASALSDALGASPIVLKGPAIGDRFYPDPALRTFADLDLLVAPADLERGAHALTRLSYAQRVELQPGFGASHGHDIHLTRPVGRQSADIELHWRIGDDVAGESLSYDVLEERSEPPQDSGTEAGAAYRYPDTGDQLLVCAIHLLSDRLKRLSWIEDLRRVSDALGDPAWAATFDRASDLNLLWVLHRALDYAEHHLGLQRDRPLPAGDPPPFGPLRAVEELDLGASVHVGRLAALPWRDRPRYIRDVAVPSRAGLEGTVGGDGASGPRLALRHLGQTIRGFRRRR